MAIKTLPSSEKTRAGLARVFGPIANDLAETDRILKSALASRYSFVQTIVDHATALCGKRLRPALLLLTARACGGIRQDHRVLAAVVEMIHAATLVHDDVLDESEMRRHTATVSAEWGNETAVLLGDYLFTHAFHLAASLDSTLACRWIGKATNDVCEGEMLQVHNRGNLDLQEAAYLSIIRGKTAELTAVACKMGAHYAGATSTVTQALETYGREVGVAFQIADDVLDLLGEEQASGKTLGTDLTKQKLTLPVIRLIQTSAPDAAARVRRLLEEPSSVAREALLAEFEGSMALESAWERAEESIARATAALESLPDSDGRDALRQLANLVVQRSY